MANLVIFFGKFKFYYKNTGVNISIFNDFRGRLYLTVIPSVELL